MNVLRALFKEDAAKQGLDADDQFMLNDGRKVVAVWLKYPTQFIPNPNYAELVKFIRVNNQPYNWVGYLDL